ncbi:hypothetical protein ES703_103675 [subsurface metagenome]
MSLPFQKIRKQILRPKGFLSVRTLLEQQEYILFSLRYKLYLQEKEYQVLKNNTSNQALFRTLD